MSVGTKKDPVIVSGMAAVLEVSTEGEPRPKKRKRLPAVLILNIETEIAEESRYVEDLLAPPDKLPIEVANLHEFLSQISRLLPVSLPRFVSLRDPKLVKLSSLGKTTVAECVGSACSAVREHPDNEADSLHKLRLVTGDFLYQLNALASSEYQLLSLRMTMDSMDSMDASRNFGTVTTATASVCLKRPDFLLYISNALILRWENEFDPAGFETALKENTKKLKVWSYLFYGTLPYVIGGCCGGSIFQWLMLSKKGTCIVAEPISKHYDLWTVKGVVQVLHSVVQMHRLLQKLCLSLLHCTRRSSIQME